MPRSVLQRVAEKRKRQCHRPPLSSESVRSLHVLEERPARGWRFTQSSTQAVRTYGAVQEERPRQLPSGELQSSDCTRGATLLTRHQSVRLGMMLPARIGSSKTATAHLFILNMVVLPPITLPSAASGVITCLLFNLKAPDNVERHSRLAAESSAGRCLLAERNHDSSNEQSPPGPRLWHLLPTQ